MVALVGRHSGALDQSLVVGRVVLETGAEELGLGGLEITAWGVGYAT